MQVLISFLCTWQGNMSAPDKKKNLAIYMTAKEPNQNHLSGAKSGTHVLMFPNKNYQVSFYISYCH